MIPAILVIRRNSDGIIRKDPKWFDYREGKPWEGQNDEFLWSEGNFACDCNRADFFAKAAREPKREQVCGHTEYAVMITDSDGNVIYEDFSDSENMLQEEGK